MTWSYIFPRVLVHGVHRCDWTAATRSQSFIFKRTIEIRVRWITLDDMDRTMKPIVILFLFSLLAGIVFFTFLRDSNHEKASILPHECYVWQRVWNEDLRDSIQRAQPDLKGFTVLAAEIDVRPDSRQQQIMSVDYPFLSTLSVPVGLAIRINPYSGSFDKDAPASQSIHRIIKKVLEKARDAGFKPSEIQIDYDCAESKLAGYRQWIQALKKSFHSHPITITALPSWMNRRQFKKLARDCDGYVLQVHSLEKPNSIQEKVQLCNPTRAIKWVQQAERFGVPFRVALPTYGYLVAYDQQGQFIGLTAEGVEPPWKHDSQIKTVLSDPYEIANLIKAIRAKHPKNLSGFIWFRLPVDSDVLNWQWHTLQRLVQNQPLTERINVLLDWPQPGLVEVYLVNAGDVDRTDSFAVQLSFQNSCLAADGLRGYAVVRHSAEVLLFASESQDGLERLRAREKIKIGWCRFDKETEVKADVQFWK